MTDANPRGRIYLLKEFLSSNLLTVSRLYRHCIAEHEPQQDEDANHDSTNDPKFYVRSANCHSFETFLYEAKQRRI